MLRCMRYGRNYNICYFAKTNFRNQKDTFGILLDDRLYSFYIIGKTGTGKSTLLLNKIRQDIEAGRGVCCIDVHELIPKILQHIPEHRKKDIIHLDASDTNLSIGYNPLKRVSFEKRALITANILETFERLWGSQSYGVKMAHLLRNIILTLLDQTHATLADILRILQDKEYREACRKNVISPYVKQFWDKEFKHYEGKSDLIPIYNKIGALLSYPSVKRIFIDNKKQLSLRKIIDEQKVLLVSIPKGSIGNEPAYIIGSLLLTSLAGAFFTRFDIPEHKRTPYFVYLDEFHNFTNRTLVEMLSELRKVGAGFIMAHQYISQLDPKIRDTVLGNVGSIVCFRLGQVDAKIMEREFFPTFKAQDFINLANHDIYLKMMIQGKVSRAFSAQTLPPYHF